MKRLFLLFLISLSSLGLGIENEAPGRFQMIEIVKEEVLNKIRVFFEYKKRVLENVTVSIRLRNNNYSNELVYLNSISQSLLLGDFFIPFDHFQEENVLIFYTYNRNFTHEISLNFSKPSTYYFQNELNFQSFKSQERLSKNEDKIVFIEGGYLSGLSTEGDLSGRKSIIVEDIFCLFSEKNFHQSVSVENSFFTIFDPENNYYLLPHVNQRIIIDLVAEIENVVHYKLAEKYFYHPSFLQLSEYHQPGFLKADQIFLPLTNSSIKSYSFIFHTEISLYHRYVINYVFKISQLTSFIGSCHKGEYCVKVEYS